MPHISTFSSLSQQLRNESSNSSIESTSPRKLGFQLEDAEDRESPLPVQRSDDDLDFTLLPSSLNDLLGAPDQDVDSQPERLSPPKMRTVSERDGFSGNLM